MSFVRKPQALASGFTLLELLVALTIFAIVAVLAYGGLNNILKADIQLRTQNARLAAVQWVFSQMSQDFSQQLGREARDEFGDRLPALQGSHDQVQFSRAGWANPLQQPRSQLQRVEWTLARQQLTRAYWLSVDRARDTLPQRTVLLEPVTALRLRYLDNRQQWHEVWPPLSVLNTTTQELPPSLAGVEVVLDLPDWGPLRRIFEVPLNALPPTPDAEADQPATATDTTPQTASESPPIRPITEITPITGIDR